MEKDITQLEADNKRLTDALIKARAQLDKLKATLDSVNDLITAKNEGHVTDDDVKNLIVKPHRTNLAL